MGVFLVGVRLGLESPSHFIWADKFIIRYDTIDDVLIPGISYEIFENKLGKIKARTKSGSIEIRVGFHAPLLGEISKNDSTYLDVIELTNGTITDGKLCFTEAIDLVRGGGKFTCVVPPKIHPVHTVHTQIIPRLDRPGAGASVHTIYEQAGMTYILTQIHH